MIFSAGWPESETGENMMCPTIAPLSSAISETSGRACSRRASTRLASAGVSNADTFTACTAAQSLRSSARISMCSLKTHNRFQAELVAMLRPCRQGFADSRQFSGKLPPRVYSNAPDTWPPAPRERSERPPSHFGSFAPIIELTQEAGSEDPEASER